jgi:APA family basic amino acid/polyamine antiporter
LPKLFSRVHKQYRTPDFSTCCRFRGEPRRAADIGTLTDLSNIGTLFAFGLVAAGVLILHTSSPSGPAHFVHPAA